MSFEKGHICQQLWARKYAWGERNGISTMPTSILFGNYTRDTPLSTAATSPPPASPRIPYRLSFIRHTECSLFRDTTNQEEIGRIILASNRGCSWQALFLPSPSCRHTGRNGRIKRIIETDEALGGVGTCPRNEEIVLGIHSISL